MQFPGINPSSCYMRCDTPGFVTGSHVPLEQGSLLLSSPRMPSRLTVFSAIDFGTLARAALVVMCTHSNDPQRPLIRQQGQADPTLWKLDLCRDWVAFA